MLLTSFSSKLFQDFFDKENRKGVSVEEKFKGDFSESLAKAGKLKNVEKIQQEKDSDAGKLLYA